MQRNAYLFRWMNYSIGEKAVLLPNTKQYLWRSNEMIHSGSFRLCRSKAKSLNTALFWTSSGRHAMVWGRKWNSTKFTLNSKNKRTYSQLGVCAAFTSFAAVHFPAAAARRLRRRRVDRWRLGECRRLWSPATRGSRGYFHFDKYTHRWLLWVFEVKRYFRLLR